MELFAFIADIITMISGMDTICVRIKKLCMQFHNVKKNTFLVKEGGWARLLPTDGSLRVEVANLD